MELIIVILLLVVAYFVGTAIEKSHFAKIKQREIELLQFPYVSFETNVIDKTRKIKNIELVSGEIAIGADYFKEYISSIKSFFGGRLSSYEPILDRARREAMLRMRERALGADIIVNVRLDTANLNAISNVKQPARLSIFAYGTAITYEK